MVYGRVRFSYSKNALLLILARLINVKLGH